MWQTAVLSTIQVGKTIGIQHSGTDPSLSYAYL